MEVTGISKEEKLIIGQAEKDRESGVLSEEKCQSILESAAELKSDALFGVGYFYFAEYYYFHSSLDNSMHWLNECVKRFSATKQTEYLARTYNLMGMASGDMGNRLGALNYFYISLRYTANTDFYYTRARSYSNLGVVFMQMRKYADAAEEFQKALKYFDEYNGLQAGHITDSVVMLGISFALSGNFKGAVEMYKKAEEMREKYPDARYSKLTFHVLEATVRFAEGDFIGARLIVMSDEVLKPSPRHERELMNMIIPAIDLLIQADRESSISWVLANLTDKQIESNPEVFMTLYPYISRQYVQDGRFDKYREGTARYLDIYEEHTRTGLQMTARILEMSGEIKSMERKQERLKFHNSTLRNIAYYDSMTELPNRAYLNEYLSEKFEDAKESKQSLGIELMDIDKFKKYNDTYGHLQGDECIIAVGKALKKYASEDVFCARYGGDEFMVVYTGVEPDRIKDIVVAIRDDVRNMEIITEDGHVTNVTLSQGVFTKVPEDEHEWDFSSKADVCLYESKKAGRDQITMNINDIEKETF
ncbi:MAG: GGDEF domain-containing protein [Lachnospiraceae bacterium]|nr:GGDEF domain-containing protein [Lachnospiraceae bacterium]